ncbi:neuroguidin isoform X2 [Echeneis naucrates]|uniref:neuroguidin isoform X2 n=1 Tax=Echeneis naucrates TaxID=173247 RepID=UPI0011137D5B|nr:neuroguidin isoform X2 [Echeneis naucrates]
MAAAVANNLIQSDLPKAVELLNNLTEQVASVTSNVQELLTKVKDGKLKTFGGLSFLDLRYHLLLFYLQDLIYLISIKSEGGSIKESDGLIRVVTVRSVLEKMRPLDHKLKYQIDKLVHTALTGSLDGDDPLQLRPNPGNLLSKLEESEQSRNEDELKTSSQQRAAQSAGRKYVPPKIAPMHYDGDLSEADRKKAQLERQRQTALRSSVIRELRQQYSDAPEEFRDRQDFQSERESREETHRRNYEESMMVRLNTPKHQKNARKRRMMAMTSQLSGITHFGDITVLTGGETAQCRTETTLVQRKRNL